MQTSLAKRIPNGIGSGNAGLLSNVLVSYGGTAVGADESIVERFYLCDRFEWLSAALVAGNLNLIHFCTPDWKVVVPSVNHSPLNGFNSYVKVRELNRWCTDVTYTPYQLLTISRCASSSVRLPAQTSLCR